MSDSAHDLLLWCGLASGAEPFVRDTQMDEKCMRSQDASLRGPKAGLPGGRRPDFNERLMARVPGHVLPLPTSSLCQPASGHPATSAGMGLPSPPSGPAFSGTLDSFPGRSGLLLAGQLLVSSLSENRSPQESCAQKHPPLHFSHLQIPGSGLPSPAPSILLPSALRCVSPACSGGSQTGQSSSQHLRLPSRSGH